MIQVAFAEKAKKIFQANDNVIGLAVVGSWLTQELDEFSDLDLIIVTQQKVGGLKDEMLAYAQQLGNFLSGFTGEHVGEPRVLICLFDNPLLHVDLKFLTLDEFQYGIETPVILLDKEDQLQHVLTHATAKFPYPDFQWIEDRFWTWIHYALLKIGRGEYFEAFDFIGFLRITVLGPLLHLKNGNLPRGVRKVETIVPREELNQLIATIPAYNKLALLKSLNNAVSLYRSLRISLFGQGVKLHAKTEESVMLYFDEIAAK